MWRPAALLTGLSLFLGLLLSPALAAVRPNDEVLFTAGQPAAAMKQLEERLALIITDTSGTVSLDTLRILEVAVNSLSADLVREAVQRLNNRYGVSTEIRFVPYSGQIYAGLTSLTVSVSTSLCTVELVLGPSGPDTDTMVHELCHLIHFAMLDEQNTDPLSRIFPALNGGIPYETDYIPQGGLDWQAYLNTLDADPTRYFTSDYAMTSAYEDFACLFQSIVHSSQWWEQRLLREEYAPLRAKYTAAVAALENAFSSGADSPLTDLFPADWAIAQWQRAKALELVPDDLDRAYDAPITRAEFCRLMVRLLAVLWGEDPAARLTAIGMEATRSRFPDCDETAVYILAALGVVDGRPDGTFGPEDSITRQEAAKLLARTASAAGLELTAEGALAFSDRDQISPWAEDFVQTVSAAGIMTGTGGGQFSPLAGYDRQQSFVTVARLYDLMTAHAAGRS